MWTTGASVFLVSTFHRTAPGVLSREFMGSFAIDASTFALLSALYFYVYAGLLVPSGLFVDTYGPRLVLTCSSTVMGVGTLLMAWAGDVRTLFIGRFMLAAGASAIFVCTLKIASLWLPAQQFAMLSGLTLSVGTVGALAGTLPFAVLVSLIGWRSGLALTGGLALLLAVVAWSLVRDRPALSPAGSDPHGRPVGTRSTLKDTLTGMIAVVKNPPSRPPMIAFALIYSAWFNLLLWATPCLRDVYGLATAPAAGYAAAISLGFLIAAPLTGYAFDRVFQCRRLPYVALCVGQFLALVLFLVGLGRAPLWAVWLFLFAIGMTGGAFVLTYPLIRNVNPPELAGVSVALVNFTGFLGAAVSQGLTGVLLDTLWAGDLREGARAYPVHAYTALFLGCALLLLGAVLSAARVHETGGRSVRGVRSEPTSNAPTSTGPEPS